MSEPSGSCVYRVVGWQPRHNNVGVAALTIFISYRKNCRLLIRWNLYLFVLSSRAIDSLKSPPRMDLLLLLRTYQ